MTDLQRSVKLSLGGQLRGEKSYSREIGPPLFVKSAPPCS